MGGVSLDSVCLGLVCLDHVCLAPSGGGGSLLPCLWGWWQLLRPILPKDSYGFLEMTSEHTHGKGGGSLYHHHIRILDPRPFWFRLVVVVDDPTPQPSKWFLKLFKHAEWPPSQSRRREPPPPPSKDFKWVLDCLRGPVGSKLLFFLMLFWNCLGTTLTGKGGAATTTTKGLENLRHSAFF